MINGIFPILTFNPSSRKWKCLGTGFFISPVGAFVTAKHLFMNSDGEAEKTLYGVQSLSEKEHHVRPVKKLIYHKDADLIIGLLGNRRIGQKDFPPHLTEYYGLDLNTLENGDEIETFAYPNTLNTELEGYAFEFSFDGITSSGSVIDYHEGGSPVVKNRCYQTNMKIDSGASGGPVFKDGYVVGVNSSGFSLADEEEPLSFITPIDYILDLSVTEDDRIIPVKELIKEGFIIVK
jgi:Trypsin-like peptidase domain